MPELTKEEKAAKLANVEKVAGEATKMATEANEEAARLRKELGLPAPENGGGGGVEARTFEQFQTLSPAERTQFYREHPTEYSKFMDQIRTKNERDLFNKGQPTL